MSLFGIGYKKYFFSKNNTGFYTYGQGVFGETYNTSIDESDSFFVSFGGGIGFKIVLFKHLVLETKLGKKATIISGSSPNFDQEKVEKTFYMRLLQIGVAF